MIVRHCIGGLGIVAAAAAAQAQVATTTVDIVVGLPAVDRATQTEDVRFRNERDDRLTVPVRLSGKGPYQFIVDTGADRTAISREVASRLGLVNGIDASVHTVTGVSTVTTAHLPQLQLTRKALKLAEAPVFDSANIGADGILGVDSLRSQRVLFDFETRTLSIVPSSAPDFRYEPGTIVVQAARKNGRLVVTDAYVNGRPVTVVIDTGSQISIGNRALRDQLSGRASAGAGQKIDLQSVTGETISGDYTSVRALDMGCVTLNNLGIVFADAHTFKQLKLDKKPALLLGMNAIRAFKKVSIDFASRKFRVVLPETSRLEVQLASVRLR